MKILPIKICAERIAEYHVKTIIYCREKFNLKYTSHHDMKFEHIKLEAELALTFNLPTVNIYFCRSVVSKRSQEKKFIVQENNLYYVPPCIVNIKMVTM